MSPLQFAGTDLCKTVAAAVDSNHVEPSDVVLEITESAAFDPRSGIPETLGELRKMGARVAIDDFGTGYSSLSQLRQVQADVLKLDKTFIDHLVVSARDRAVVSAIITVAEQLSILPVAEGVETEEQLAWLREMGCEHAQGFLFARPSPPGTSLLVPQIEKVPGFRTPAPTWLPPGEERPL